MSISSINFQTAKLNSTSHMKRETFVSYLLEHSSEFHSYKKYEDEKEYLEFAKLQTKIKTKRNMQKLAVDNFVQEAVLNIQESTTFEDVENLFRKLNSEFNGGFKVFDIALHKDEGVFIRSKYDVKSLTFNSKTLKIYDEDDNEVTNEVLVYAPNRDIFYNKNDEKWYKEKTFKTEFDTSNLQKKLNLHAHIKFTKYDENNGKNIRLQKKDLQTIQDITAEQMQMQRGSKNDNFKRMNHYELKKIYSKKEEIKKEEIYTKKIIKKANTLIKEEKAKAKELENLLKEKDKEIRNLMKEVGNLKRADFAEIEALKKELLNSKASEEVIEKSYRDLQTKYESQKNELHFVKCNETNFKQEKRILESALEEREKELDVQIFRVNTMLKEIEKLEDEMYHPVFTTTSNQRVKNIDAVDFLIIEIEEKNKKIESLETANKALQAQNNTLSNESIVLNQRIVSNASTSDYEAIKKENESLKKENESLKSRIKNILSLANEKIKSLFKFKIYNDVIFRSSDDHLLLEEWNDRCNDRVALETRYDREIERELIQEKEVKEERKEVKMIKAFEELSTALEKFNEKKEVSTSRSFNFEREL